MNILIQESWQITKLRFFAVAFAFIRRLIVSLFAIIATPLTVANADESFACRSNEMALSDDELLNIAFRYEENYATERYTLTDDWVELGLQGLREANPNCCFVQRENNPYNENRDWWTRLLSQPSILVTIKWDLDSMNLAAPRTRYFLSLCGEVFERHGTPENRIIGEE